MSPRPEAAADRGSDFVPVHLVGGSSLVVRLPGGTRMDLAAMDREALQLAIGPPAPRFGPELSAVSLSRAAWVKRCWLRSFGRNLPGLASGACNGGNRNDSSRVMILRSSSNAIRASQAQ